MNTIAKAAFHLDAPSWLCFLVISITENVPRLYFNDWLYQHCKHRAVYT